MHDYGTSDYKPEYYTPLMMYNLLLLVNMDKGATPFVYSSELLPEYTFIGVLILKWSSDHTIPSQADTTKSSRNNTGTSR